MRDDFLTLKNRVYKGWARKSDDEPCKYHHDWVPDASGYRCETCGWCIDYERVIEFLVEEGYL